MDNIFCAGKNYVLSGHILSIRVKAITQVKISRLKALPEIRSSILGYKIKI